jgi:hypothetical protein
MYTGAEEFPAKAQLIDVVPPEPYDPPRIQTVSPGLTADAGVHAVRMSHGLPIDPLFPDHPLGVT